MHLLDVEVVEDRQHVEADAAVLTLPFTMLRDVKLVKKTRLLSLAEMRAAPSLATMQVLQRGNRLSITPVDEVHWHLIADGLLA